MNSQPSTFHRLHSFALLLATLTLYFTANPSAAQTASSPLIKVESREVILPVEVIRETKSTGVLLGSNGEAKLGWIYHSKAVTKLSARSVHIFEDGVEQKIESFIVQAAPGPVTDNVGQHLEFSWTPTGIWTGGEDTNRTLWGPVHGYFLTYIPPASPKDSCHQIAVKVDRKHISVLAPDRYCNTKHPLSDPLNGVDLGNKLLNFANSSQIGTLPLTVQLSAFANSSGTFRVNLSAGIPANLLKRRWEGNHFFNPTAILGLIYDENRTIVERFSDTECVPPECTVWYDGSFRPANSDMPVPLFSEIESYVEQLAMPTVYQTQVELSPGNYRLDLVITDGEQFGRTTALLTIDEFKKDRLAISGIALCKRFRQASEGPRSMMRGPQYVPLVAKGKEFTPAGDTLFRKSDLMTIYFEVYEPLLQQKEAVNLQLEMKVTNEKTGFLEIGTGLRTVDFTGMRASDPVIPTVWNLAVDKLPPGNYRLEVQASDSSGNKTPWRSVTFSVE